MTKGYPRGVEFPSEAFVQRAIEAHFRAAGYELSPNGYVDLSCRHPTTGQRWQIEAKGKTSSPGLDLQTCLGQLIVRMSDPDIRYAVALPDVPTYRKQIEQVKPWVTERLNLSWILVSPEGQVTIDGGHGE